MRAFRIFPFAGLVGGSAAVGEDEAGHAVGREVVDEVLHPGEVGVALGGTPNYQRTSSSLRNQSESFKDGLLGTRLKVGPTRFAQKAGKHGAPHVERASGSG